MKKGTRKKYNSANPVSECIHGNALAAMTENPTSISVNYKDIDCLLNKKFRGRRFQRHRWLNRPTLSEHWAVYSYHGLLLMTSR